HRLCQKSSSAADVSSQRHFRSSTEESAVAEPPCQCIPHGLRVATGFAAERDWAGVLVFDDGQREGAARRAGGATHVSEVAALRLLRSRPILKSREAHGQEE